MNRPSPEQILAQQSAIARSQRLRSQVTKQQQEANRTQYAATILSFDATSGLYLCQLTDGSIVNARTIANTGGKGAGSLVSLYKPATGMAIVKWL